MGGLCCSLSQGDYIHLMRLLTASFFETSQTFATACQQRPLEVDDSGKWVIPAPVRREVAEIVTETLAKFPVYSKELAGKLNLAGISS